jgi:hypothetical protein
MDLGATRKMDWKAVVDNASNRNPETSKVFYCDVATPFLWSKNDTRETQNQATEFNRIGKEICRWQ